MPSSSRKKSRRAKRYRDNGEDNYRDDAAAADQEEEPASSSSEEEVVQIFETRQDRAQRVRRKIQGAVQDTVEQPKARRVCVRYCLFLLVAGLGVGMLVQLYASYGEFLSDQIFPPRVSSAAATVCGDGTMARGYQIGFQKFEVVNNASASGWLHLNATQPKDSVEWGWYHAAVAPDPEQPQRAPRDTQAVDVRWKNKETLLAWLPDKSGCLDVVVISL